MRTSSFFALGLGLALGSSSRLCAQQEKRPTLLVFITVDQMKPDYLDMFRSQFTGGFARLLNGGAFYTNAFHDHAVTETAPGHSVVMSGRYPRSTGILNDTLGVSDPPTKVVAYPGPGASPYRFRGSVLMDWLRLKDPSSRGLSVS